jgi:hypothetical protein
MELSPSVKGGFDDDNEHQLLERKPSVYVFGFSKTPSLLTEKNTMIVKPSDVNYAKKISENSPNKRDKLIMIDISQKRQSNFHSPHSLPAYPRYYQRMSFGIHPCQLHRQITSLRILYHFSRSLFQSRINEVTL